MKLLKSIFLLTVLFSSSILYAQKSHFDENKWVEYIEGNMPLVISVPHGGRVTVDTLAIRNCKGAVTVTDGNTIELAKEIQNYFQKTYKKTPHIIISHLSRKHVDQNREFENGATCGDVRVEKPWHAFHDFVDAALKSAAKSNERVMYIDLHGHGHPNQRLEIGYNLTAEDLKSALEGKFNDKKKYHSLTNLLAMDRSLSFKDVIFGEQSFGALAAKNGVPAVPSDVDLAPKDGEKFFSGGDNTRRFTGDKYPFVYGLQIECNGAIRKLENRKASAKGIAEAISQYISIYGK